MGMDDSIFSKIIRHEVPAQRVYEDDHVIAIMDINPVSEGHVLVIPKEPAETMAELSDEFAAAIGKVLPRITRAVKKVTGAPAVNILQNNGGEAGQVVMHVHVHVIPRFPDREAAGLRVDWRATEGDKEQLAELGRKLARML